MRSVCLKLRKYIDERINKIISDQGLNRICRLRPIRELQARLDLAMSKRDQKAVDRISITLASTISSKHRKNKKKNENKRRNNEFLSMYVAHLT